jgi:hypothetical protein
LPSWLPDEVDPIPLLSYHEEKDNPNKPPVEAVLTAKYSNAQGDILLELTQWYGYYGFRRSADSPDRESKWLTSRLIAWQLNWDWDQAQAVETNVVSMSQTHRDNELTYYAVEITAPSYLCGSIIA